MPIVQTKDRKTQDVANTLALGSAGFFALTATERESVEQSLKALIFTNPGERHMRPDIGTPLDTLVFDPSTDVFASLLRTHIKSQVQQFEPRVVIDEIIVDRVDADLGMKVNVVLVWHMKSSNLRGRTPTSALFSRAL